MLPHLDRLPRTAVGQDLLSAILFAREFYGLPSVGQVKLADPALDVLDVEHCSLDLDDSGDVSKLPLGLPMAGPFELGDDRVLCGRDVDVLSEQGDALTATEFLDAERALLLNDEIGFPPGLHVDDVEL